MSRVQDLVEEHVTNSGGSVFKLFQFFDRDGSSYIEAKELVAGLNKLGGDFSLSDCQRIIRAMDENDDGLASYFEFARLLAGTQSSTMIDDETHWAFYLFEDLRRKIQHQDKSLMEIFAPKQSRKSKGRGSNKDQARDVLIPWEDFMGTLERKLHVRPLSKDNERELRALLDAEEPQGTGDQPAVNLSHFHSLVGLADDPQGLEYDSPSKIKHQDQREVLAELMR